MGKPQPEWTVKRITDKDLTYFLLVHYRGYPHSPWGDADKDEIQNIFDKLPLDPRVHKQVPPAMKEGNYKLDRVIGIFSLPRYWTCPGKTRLCSRYCYAEQPEKFRGSVVYSRNKNFAWTLRDDFADVVARMIQSFQFPYFRIHESGDFYNQAYLDKWIEVARRNPKTKFLAYVKNYHLDYTKAPKNLIIRYSSDISSTRIREDLSQCFVGVNKPENFFYCKKKCLPGFCMACWDPKVDVYIPIHSISKKQVDQMFFKQFNPNVPEALKHRKPNPREDYLGYKWGGKATKKQRKLIRKGMRPKRPRR